MTTKTTTTEMHIDWYSDSPETFELTTDNAAIIKNLIKAGLAAEDTPTDGVGVLSFHIPQQALTIGMQPEAAPKAPRKPANRPERTFEQKVTKLFQLRRGKMVKERGGKALTKKQEKELMAQCEATVRAKAEAAGAEEAPAPADPVEAAPPAPPKESPAYRRSIAEVNRPSAPAAPVEETPETPEEETPETPVDWGDQEFEEQEQEWDDLEPTPETLARIEQGFDDPD